MPLIRKNSHLIITIHSNHFSEIPLPTSTLYYLFSHIFNLGNFKESSKQRSYFAFHLSYSAHSIPKNLLDPTPRYQSSEITKCPCPSSALGGPFMPPGGSSQKHNNTQENSCVAWRLWRPAKRFLGIFQKPRNLAFIKRNHTISCYTSCS